MASMGKITDQQSHKHLAWLSDQHLDPQDVQEGNSIRIGNLFTDISITKDLVLYASLLFVYGSYL